MAGAHNLVRSPVSETSKITILITRSYCIVILLAIVLYVVLWKENKKRGTLPMNEAERDSFAFRDLTDKENPYFRYVL